MLAGLDLGDYTGLTTIDDVTGSSQELLADVYVARRGNWQAENEYFNACDALWGRPDRRRRAPGRGVSGRTGGPTAPCRGAASRQEVPRP